MIVVADSSPLIVLVKIKHLDVLPKLFGNVAIPPAVAGELAARERPAAVRRLIASLPTWLQIHSPAKVLPLPGLHPGETEAIALATELKADLILIDERKAYRQAIACHLNAIGTIRVLERAASEGLLPLDKAFEAVKKTDFWISHELLDERLRLHRRGKT
jgi:predicted nucleic acid-binding protein